MGIRNYITFQILIGTLLIMKFFSLMLRVAVEVINKALEPHDVTHGMYRHDGCLCVSHHRKEDRLSLCQI